MKFGLDATPFIFGILIIALVGAVLGFASPEIQKVLAIQDTMKINASKADAEIAKQQAQAVVAPTIAAQDVAIKNLEILSRTQSIENNNKLAQAQISSTIAVANAQSQATIHSAIGESERNKTIGDGIKIVLVSISIFIPLIGLAFLWHKRQNGKELFLLEKGKTDVRIAEVQVLSKAVDVLSQSGGEMVLDNGRVLRFQPKQELLIPANTGHVINENVRQKEIVQ